VPWSCVSLKTLKQKSDGGGVFSSAETLEASRKYFSEAEVMGGKKAARLGREERHIFCYFKHMYLP